MNQQLYMVSTWENAYQKGSPINKNVLEILLDIVCGTHQKEVATIRQTTNKEQRNKLKNQLLSVYFSGVFADRKEKSIIRHTGLICLDIDGVLIERLKEIKELLKSDVYIMAYFVSPSGNGLKVLVKIPSNIQNHLFSYLALERYFEKQYQIILDKKCKNINRFCFVSYDSQLHINKQSEVFTELLRPKEAIKPNRATKITNRSTGTSIKGFVTSDSPIIEKLDLAAKLLGYTQNGGFYEGNKHTSAGTFALFCNKMGIDQEDAENYFYSNFPKNKCNAFQQEYRNTSHWNTWEWKRTKSPNTL